MPRKKRRRTWGSITTVSRGKHVLRWVENTPEGRKRRSRTFHGTYKEADAELARIRVRVGDDAPVPTVGQAYRLWWLPWMERRVDERKAARSTLYNYTRTWANLCSRKWADTPVDSIRPRDVQGWLDGLAAGNAKIAISLMRRVVDFAVKYEAVDANKFRIEYEMPAPGSVRRKDVYSLDEARGLFLGLRGDPIEAAYILAAFGSCRTGESLAASVDDVERREACGVTVAAVRICRTMTQNDDVPRDRLKTPQSVRTVCVPGEYGERLLEIAEERRAEGSAWLVHCGDGVPMNVSKLNYRWRRGGPGRIPFANLRNSWRTFAQAEWGMGYDLLEVLMGHLLPGVTGRHYLRMSAAQLADQVGACYAAYLER